MSDTDATPAAYKRITMVGNGSMATVLALLLESKGCTVTMWGATPAHMDELIQTRENRRYLPGHPIPDSIHITASEARACEGAELLINAIPTQYIRKTWARLLPYLPEGAPVASVAKGVEVETALRPSQVIAEVVREKGERSLAALSGPSVAHELARCLPATVSAASEDLEFAQRLQRTFTTHWFRVYTNPDMLGTELAGATKNVIALAAGILDGLQAGNNAKSALLARGLAEITRLGLAMGARTETFFGIAGVGDLATTCFSPTGRNRTCGEQLGRGRKLDEVLAEIPGVVEGVPTTRAVMKLAEQHDVEMPITASVHEVLFNNLDPLEGISRLMRRDPKAEVVG